MGREGTAVQMGGAVAGLLTKWFTFSKKERSLLIICGISAGFSSIFGTPWAGTIFSLEVLALSSFSLVGLLPSLMTAFWANSVATFLGASHTRYPIGEIPAWSFKLFFYLIIFGLLFGLTSRLFSQSLHFLKKLGQTYCPNPLIRIGLGSLIVVMLIFNFHGLRYSGISLELLRDAFNGQAAPFDFMYKLALTVLSLGSGFQGGEVTPLFEIGATLGSNLALLSDLPIGFVAALGFIGVFAGASNTPVASFVMGVEIFGFDAALSMLLICLLSYSLSGRRGIYTSQNIVKGKFNYFI